MNIRALLPLLLQYQGDRRCVFNPTTPSRTCGPAPEMKGTALQNVVKTETSDGPQYTATRSGAPWTKHFRLTKELTLASANAGVKFRVRADRNTINDIMVGFYPTKNGWINNGHGSYMWSMYV